MKQPSLEEECENVLNDPAPPRLLSSSPSSAQKTSLKLKTGEVNFSGALTYSSACSNNKYFVFRQEKRTGRYCAIKMGLCLRIWLWRRMGMIVTHMSMLSNVWPPRNRPATRRVSGKPRASRVVCRLHALVGRYLAIRDESCRRHRRSVFHTHTDHDENRIVLLLAALDWRHRSPWSNWKRSLLHVCRRT